MISKMRFRELSKHADWLVKIGHYKSRRDALQMLVDARERDINAAKEEAAKVVNALEPERLALLQMLKDSPI